jgi:hypothetical protein
MHSEKWKWPNLRDTTSKNGASYFIDLRQKAHLNIIPTNWSPLNNKILAPQLITDVSNELDQVKWIPSPRTINKLFRNELKRLTGNFIIFRRATSNWMW